MYSTIEWQQHPLPQLTCTTRDNGDEILRRPPRQCLASTCPPPAPPSNALDGGSIPTVEGSGVGGLGCGYVSPTSASRTVWTLPDEVLSCIIWGCS